MDPIPVGYRVMGEETATRAGGVQHQIRSRTRAGDARQYAIVDLDTSPVGTKAVDVELRIAGDTHWYANDFGGGGTVFYKGGHSRTAVKLPLDWHGKAITGCPGPAVPDDPRTRHPAVDHDRTAFRVLEVRSNYTTAYRSVPAPSVVVNP